ncbi:MAG: glycogen synthase GlgA, partial [Thermodesulfobacteriota bacterium]|nr:glycogen synthase GlgA [Thermodesulfobacteriota bacterium]
SAGLPAAVQALGQEITLIVPAYADALAGVDELHEVAATQISACGKQRNVRLWQGNADGIGCPLLLVEIAGLFDRPGNPYQSADGTDWSDNGERFALFSQVVADVAMDRLGLHWQPDVVHCNDWQTGLVLALLSHEADGGRERPGTVFTIHNLSYGGHFPYSLFEGLGLPSAWWHFKGIEFYGAMSMLKGGIVFADHVTTVSPSYADEICTQDYGFGLHGALQQRRQQKRLHGIVNGIDTQVWNPQLDPFLPFNYSVQRGRVAQKKRNKLALLKMFDEENAAMRLAFPLIGFVGRLVEQKGVDFMIEALPELVESTDACFVIVGSGMPLFEQQLTVLARRFPKRIFVTIGYEEKLAHLVEGGIDMFLMPSRFEPCGLNQLYSLSYGTPPIVHRTGGLKDTVVDANETTLADGSATGFVFDSPDSEALCRAVVRALSLYKRPRRWQALQKTGMLHDFGWQRSAQIYLELYHQATHKGDRYDNALA